MSLTVTLNKEKYVSYDKGQTYTKEYKQLYWSNITHNLGKMAKEAGIYEALWRPYMLKKEYDKHNEDWKKELEFEENQTIIAREIIPILEKGLSELKSKPEHFKKFNSPNGWGTYKNFVPFVEDYLRACKEHPDAIVIVSR